MVSAGRGQKDAGQPQVLTELDRVIQEELMGSQMGIWLLCSEGPLLGDLWHTPSLRLYPAGDEKSPKASSSMII